MSRAVDKALRRARVRALTRGAERRARPEPTTEPSAALEGAEGAQRRVKAAALELTPAELEALEKLAQRHKWARMLLVAHLEGELSELTAWNAREELEDELGHPWRRVKHKLEGTLGKKLGALFDGVD